MRILHVLQSCDGGGPAHAALLAADAARRGEEVAVAVPGRRVPGSLSRLAGRRVRVLLLGRGPLRSLVLARACLQADLVHVHGARAGLSALPGLLLRPSVLTLHGSHLLRRARGPVSRRAAWLVLRALARAATAVVAVGPGEARELSAIAADRLRLIPNAVPARAPLAAGERAAARARLGLEPDEVAVLFLGRLSPEKDPLTAARAAESLGDRRVRLLVCGDGPLRTALEPSSASIRLLGYREDVRELLAAADVLLNTSRWEGLSLALLEAMWAGLPVVASDVPGNRDALGSAGLYAPAGDPSAFAERLARLLDADRRRALGRGLRERAEREFPPERMLAATRSLYAELAAASRRAPRPAPEAAR